MRICNKADSLFCLVFRHVKTSLHTENPDVKFIRLTIRDFGNMMRSVRQNHTGIRPGGIIMLKELGISAGTFIFCAISLYFIVKWAVRNGMSEAYTRITGKKTSEELEMEKMAESANQG